MTDATHPEGESLSRREMLEVTAAALAAPLVKLGPAAAPPALQAVSKFFTAPELALLDELAELIIPADAHSPGARAAGVAAYVDFRLSDSAEPEQQTKWRSGLAAVEALSEELNNRQALLQASADQRVPVLTPTAGGEGAPKTPAHPFFQAFKGWTGRAPSTFQHWYHADP